LEIDGNGFSIAVLFYELLQVSFRLGFTRLMDYFDLKGLEFYAILIGLWRPILQSIYGFGKSLNY
jgi:hypothetical protein